MLTKSELLKLLEPFDDDIPIRMGELNQALASPRLFYTSENGYGKIIINDTRPNIEKIVELKN